MLDLAIVLTAISLSALTVAIRSFGRAMANSRQK
jgi:hypothetical protein